MSNTQEVTIIGLFLKKRIQKPSSVESLGKIHLKFLKNGILNFTVTFVQSLQKNNQILSWIVPVNSLQVFLTLLWLWEITSNQSFVDRHLISFISSDDMISKLRFTHVIDQSLILVNISFSIQLEYIDVMQVIEVLSVESTKNDHATTYKSSTVSAPWFGMISNYTSNFQAF